MAPLFVVGTGRCGSTMLSHMLRSHPSVLSVSEFFAFVTDLGGRIDAVFGDTIIDAAAYWALVAEPLPRQSQLLRHGLRMAEVIYPGGRFDAAAGVPAILQAMLPHLSETPDALFDALAAEVRTWAPATAVAHHTALFEWLTARFGKATWLERSGGTLRIVERLIAAWPDARFVHLVRDGRDCALSMSAHHGFRMALLNFQLMEMLGVDPYESADRSEIDDLPDALVDLLPEHFTAPAFEALDLPPEMIGHYWSGEIIAGLRALDRLPPERVLTLTYEHFLADPTAAVTAFATFVGAPDPAWIAEAAARVGRPRSRWRALPERRQAQLHAACAPGFEALAARGLTWD